MSWGFYAIFKFFELKFGKLNNKLPVTANKYWIAINYGLSWGAFNSFIPILFEASAIKGKQIFIISEVVLSIFVLIFYYLYFKKQNFNK